jgi:hypothetical protein
VGTWVREFTFIVDEQTSDERPFRFGRGQRRFRFGEGGQPSRLLDAGQWYAMSARCMAQAQQALQKLIAGPMDAETVDEYLGSLGYGQAAVVEVLKFIPADQQTPPDEAFWSEYGQMIRRDYDGEIVRSPLEQAIRDLDTAFQTLQDEADRAPRTIQFLEEDGDRRRIFALVRGGPDPVGHGPLSLDEVYYERYVAAHLSPDSPGDRRLGWDLAVGTGFHDLDDFFRFYGYPADLVGWVEATPLTVGWHGFYRVRTVGRRLDEVARRFGLGHDRLREAALAEALRPDSEPSGEVSHYDIFGDNWAVKDHGGRVTINPDAYRFKAWLSLEG